MIISLKRKNIFFINKHYWIYFLCFCAIMLLLLYILSSIILLHNVFREATLKFITLLSSGWPLSRASCFQSCRNASSVLIGVSTIFCPCVDTLSELLQSTQLNNDYHHAVPPREGNLFGSMSSPVKLSQK